MTARYPLVLNGTAIQELQTGDTLTGIAKADVGLGSVDNTTDAAKAISTATQAALDLKAPIASPTFTGTVGGITKAMVGLANVDNTADTAKPVSTAQQAALDLKANLILLNSFTRSLFFKADSSTVAFTKTGAGTVSIKAGTLVATPNATLTFASATAVTMPTLTAGTDYAIYACDDGTLRADASFSYPSGYSAATTRKIGGFHYAPGGNAAAQSGGDTTPTINAYSLWDIKFRPACPDPRGKALIAGGFWADIYLCGIDAITNGSSKYNVPYADGASPPKIPAAFGGNGSTAYSTFNWWEACEMASAFGMRLPTQQEFMALAYGATEAISVVTEQNSTVLNAAYTSKWGVIQATGVLWSWGAMRANQAAATAWLPATGTTASRGSEYNAPNAALFGGTWTSDTNSGSRCSYWYGAASISASSVGLRCCCNHYQAD